ncbi:hypothetical protein Tco_0571736 [Tanacetum coccineum]
MKPRLMYKLVIKVRDNMEDIDCVLFNSDVIPLLGITVDDLNNKSITEGADDPNWIVDYLINNLCAHDLKKYVGSLSSSRSVPKLVYLELSVSSQDNYCETTDYAIHDENLGSTITEYEEKLMDELEWGHNVSTFKPAVTHICTNEGPHAPNTSVNIVIVNDPNKGKEIVDAERAVAKTHVNDFTHDESSPLPELASDVNKVVCPPSSPTIE